MAAGPSFLTTQVERTVSTLGDTHIQEIQGIAMVFAPNTTVGLA